MWGFKNMLGLSDGTLTSWSFQSPWKERTLRAKCLCLGAKHSRVPCDVPPRGEFGCGIHAWSPQYIATRTILCVGSRYDIDLVRVFVLVWGSGRIVVGEHGWRAEEASIEAIVNGYWYCNTLYIPPATAEHLGAFADHYGVPAVSMDEALATAQEGDYVGL